MKQDLVEEDEVKKFIRVSLLCCQSSPSQRPSMLAVLEMLVNLSCVLENANLNWHLGIAEAVLYSPDTKVPRNAEVALRRAIPAVNPATKSIQVFISLTQFIYVIGYIILIPYNTLALLRNVNIIFLSLRYMKYIAYLCRMLLKIYFISEMSLKFLHCFYKDALC